jgi:hypothetical protein
MLELTPAALLVILAALALGGLLKGATGAGAPVVAVPVMAAFFDVRLAVIIMVAPNILTNIWQLSRFWPHRLGGGFWLRYAAAGGLGAFLGTLLLATAPARALTLLVAAAVVLYIGLRLARPDFRLAEGPARRAVAPVGVVAGILQGAAGISAPVSVSFLNAMRLERNTFIATISAFFVAMGLVQLPTLFAAGLLTLPLLGMSAAALVPLFLFMPVGAWAARHLSPRGFDRLVLALLAVLAARLIYAAFA